VLLAALGPVMLAIAGELADGTVAVWTTPRTIAEHIAPAVTRAAAAAGRPAPRVVADIIMIATADAAGARERVGTALGGAGQFASYRALLDRQGMSGIGETVIAGDEGVLERAVRAYADAGATELVASLHGSDEEKARTLEILAALRRATPE
jgi:alkanesulfonate monooxygenase SsuD/methylene tetrahydromethanopterin reductase-like flavin-dependent oxidoreductase (luciferase family)